MALYKTYYIFISALFMSLLLSPLVRKWALETGRVDEPDHRKVHTKAIPRVGGIAIYLAFLGAVLIHSELSTSVRAILAGSVFIFATGIIDDIKGVNPWHKLLGQASACAITIMLGHLYIHDLGDLFGTGHIELPSYIAIPFTVFFLVGLINAFNLIDGLDGLCGGLSIISLAALFLFGLREGNYVVLVVCAAGIGSILGFLKYNFFPASIFMGDTGSMLMGFLIGFMTINLSQSPKSNTDPLVLFLLIGIPVLDTLWVMFNRILAKKSPFHSDKTHIHHKLLRIGFSHPATVVTIYATAFVWTIVAFLFAGQPGWKLLGGFLTLSLIFYHYLSKAPENRFQFNESVRKFYASFPSLRISWRLESITRTLANIIALIIFGYLAIMVLHIDHRSQTWANYAMGIAGISVFLLLLTFDVSNRFFTAILYSASFLIVFIVEAKADELENVHRFAQGLMAAAPYLMAALMGAYFLLKKFYVSHHTITLNSLIIGISLAMAVIAPSLGYTSALSGLVLKGLTLYFGFKTVAQAGPLHAKVMAVAAFIALAFVATGAMAL